MPTQTKTYMRICIGVICATAVTIIIYISTFKLIDNDFWWHVKAGEMMWKTGSLIRTEPFSYVLADKPYGALHEWLAQVLFYFVYSTSGAMGAVLLRGIAASIAAILLMAIDKRSIFLSAPLIVWALFLHRASLMVRPQLFTFALLALSLLLLFRYVLSYEAGDDSVRKRRLYFLAVLLVQLLWVNLHGASAIFGVLLTGGLFFQGFVDWYNASETQRHFLRAELRFRLLTFGTMCLALLASPNGYETFIDMYLHRFDRTIPLVREWMPLSWKDYATNVFPFALIAGALLLLRRKAWALCFSIFAVTLLLSLQAYRHCIIFVFVCLGIILFQLADYLPWQKVRERLWRFPFAVTLGMLMLLLGIWFVMYRRDLGTVFRNNDFGFGVNIPVQGAAAFVEKAGINGTLFNTYNQGGYLLYRLSPERKVFVDGRNIEYGYPFVQKLLDATFNVVRWKELDDQYKFTYAIVEYKSMPEYGTQRPYIGHFDADPSWKIVYLDDLAAVYVRDLPEYANIIKTHAYSILTTDALEFADTLERLPADKWPEAEGELRRVIAESPESMKARIVLANHFFSEKRFDEAETLMKEAVALHPYRPEIYELLGRISVERLDWSDAGDYFEQALRYSGSTGPRINYDFLAMVFSKAGQQEKADYYHEKSLQ